MTAPPPHPRPQDSVKAEIDLLISIAKAATDYIREFDNPAPDYGHRVHLRDRLRKLVEKLPDDL